MGNDPSKTTVTLVNSTPYTLRKFQQKSYQLNKWDFEEVLHPRSRGEPREVIYQESGNTGDTYAWCDYRVFDRNVLLPVTIRIKVKGARTLYLEVNNDEQDYIQAQPSSVNLCQIDQIFDLKIREGMFPYNEAIKDQKLETDELRELIMDLKKKTVKVLAENQKLRDEIMDTLNSLLNEDEDKAEIYAKLNKVTATLSDDSLVKPVSFGTIDQGTASIPPPTSVSTTIGIKFNKKFKTVPRIFTIARNQEGTDYPDSLITSIQNASTVGFNVNIRRVDSENAWGQKASVDWIAIGTDVPKDKLITGTFGKVKNLEAAAPKKVTIPFGRTFPSVPCVLVSVRGQDDSFHMDTFAASLDTVSNSEFTVNVIRVDNNGGGWGQELNIDWMAIEVADQRLCVIGRTDVGSSSSILKKVEYTSSCANNFQRAFFTSVNVYSYPDTFGYSVRRIQNKTINVNVYRSLGTSGWGQELTLAWVAFNNKL